MNTHCTCDSRHCAHGGRGKLDLLRIELAASETGEFSGYHSTGISRRLKTFHFLELI